MMCSDYVICNVIVTTGKIKNKKSYSRQQSNMLGSPRFFANWEWTQTFGIINGFYVKE